MDEEHNQLTAEILFNLEGKIMAITHICSALAALHPDKEFIAKMLGKISENAEKETEGLPTKQAYISGIQEVIDMLSSSVHLASQAELLRDLNADEDGH